MKYTCSVCGYVYDEEAEGTPWEAIDRGWTCPICGADTSFFQAQEGAPSAAAADDIFPTEEAEQPAAGSEGLDGYLDEWKRSWDDHELDFAIVQQMAVTGRSTIEPMSTRKPVVSWDEILVLGAQLATLPRNEHEPVLTQTVIGPKAEKPLVIEIPIYISHMSFGALSREAKIALAAGSAAVGTATCSGEGGIVPEEMDVAHRYIFEYVPNQYSVTDENLHAADAVEIKIGQSAKPGMGGHLPGRKVTDEIAEVRGFPAGQDIISPAHFPDITTAGELRDKVAWLRTASAGKPIGIKLAAGHVEADLEVALNAGPDFITIDGRPGATGAAPKSVKDSTSVPTIYALSRARRYLDARRADDVSLVITGGLRTPSDVVKALAMGADAVAIATAALVAIGCQQYRICDSDRCPVGITTQDPKLRARFDIGLSAERLANYLRAATAELEDFARLTGRHDIRQLDRNDLRTTNSNLARYTGIAHVGEPGSAGE